MNTPAKFNNSKNDDGKEESSKKAVHPHSPDPTENDADSYSNTLLNESFHSPSDLQRSFSSTDSTTFSLSDPVASPTLSKHGDFNLANITIPTLHFSDDEDPSSHDSPVQMLHNCDSSPTKHETSHPSSVTAVSYVTPEWDHSYFTPPPFCDPYCVLRSVRLQLSALTYLLPCGGEDDSPVSSADHHDIIIGTRRVEAAVCAFGGLLPHKQEKRSIFREKRVSTARQQYEQVLPRRYTIHDRRISWDVEENPPIPDSATPSKRLRLDSPCSDDLQRSIGVMVYPTVHAYTAAEPGQMTPALTEMNNDACSSEHRALERPLFYSPASALTNDSSWATLHPEQFRAMAPSNGDYTYPPIPLRTYERQQWSDSLFLLARPFGMPAIVVLLEQARFEDAWDQGVAELLTQVVIAGCCAPGDARLEGLRRYLLCMGISC